MTNSAQRFIGLLPFAKMFYAHVRQESIAIRLGRCYASRMKTLFAAAALLMPLFAQGGPAPARTSTSDHSIVHPRDVKWKHLRPGAEIAVISGDPDAAGQPFVIRFRYHGDVRVPPHWHPTDEHLTVLSGTFVVGMGERFDESAATVLGAGAYAQIAARMPHYAASKGDTLVQVHGIGPFAINYVNPADAPVKK
jgi:mannose-6-phosphate isomerase-like protein (cupin superfamily)